LIIKIICGYNVIVVVLEEKIKYEFVNIFVGAKKTRIEWRLMC
jgi:hypothetical protein